MSGRRGLVTTLLYLLGRMPADIEESYEVHLLDCRRCLARARAVEHLLRLRDLQGETFDVGQPYGQKGRANVIPFNAARAGLWSAQRSWMEQGTLRALADELVEELVRAEGELKAVDAALTACSGQGELP